MIGEKLKEIRENLGLNKKEFAQYIGIKYTTYNGYETEAREPSSDFLILISEKFDVSIDYLLGLKDEREILHAYKLRSGEYEHIKKYRELDTHGKDMVDTVLQKEYDHIIELRDFAPQSKYIGKDPDNIVTVDLTPLAAHTRADVEQTPEGVQHDLDIMNDDSQWEQKGEMHMPELSRFEGMVIKMLFNDTVQHNKPHVHVTYGEYRASVGIDGELLAGSLPQKQFKMLVGWLALHEDEAYAAWNKAVRGEHFDKIKPLQ